MKQKTRLGVLVALFLAATVLPAWAQLIGTKDVGGGANDYADIVEAADDLNLLGVGAGGVTFNIFAGTYTGEVTITAVGTSGDTILFKPNGTDIVIVDSTAGSVFRLDGCAYVTIQDLTINSSTTAEGVYIQNTAVNNTLDGLKITSDGEGRSGVFMLTGGNDNTTIKSCELVGTGGANYGIYTAIQSVSITTGLTIENNMIRSFDTAGIFIFGKFNDNVTGTVYHNTIRMDSSSNITSWGLYNRSSDLAYRDNIVAHYGTLSTQYAFFNLLSNLDSDYNCFYTPDGASMGSSSGVYTLLADWVTGTGEDGNSIDGNPYFVSDSDLHIKEYSACNNSVGFDVGVALDIDGDPRDPTPDIGADENLTAYTAPPTLSGDYDIGGPTPDYSNLAEASTDLQNLDVSDVTTFHVYQGTYTDAIEIFSVIRTNLATDLITFKKAAAATGPVNIGAVVINGTSYVTLDGFDSIDGDADGTDNHAVWIKGQATNVTIKSCRIDVDGATYAGVYSDGGGNNDLTVDTCEIVGTGTADYGIYLNAPASPATTNLTIENNMIRGFEDSGIRLSGYVLGQATGTAYHNTIRLDNGTNCVYNAQASLAWRNNIYANYGSLTTEYGFYYVSGTLDSDYNCFFVPNGASTGFHTGAQATLFDWQTQTVTEDALSIDGNPFFVSVQDLHIGDSSACNVSPQVGIDVGVTLDFDGETRASPPDIGADENLNAYVPPVPMNGTFDVGGPTPDYATVEEAAGDMINLGLDGAVILDVYDGTYTGIATLDAITGNSSVNTITIQKAPAATGPVVVGAFKIEETDYVTIQDFDSIDVTDTHAIWLLVQATNVTVKNTTINLSADTFSAIYSDGGGNNNLTVDSVEIVGTGGGDYGIRLNAAASPATTGWAIENNIVRDFDNRAVFLNGWASGNATGTATYNTIRMDLGSYAVYNANTSFTWRNNIFAHLGTTATDYCYYRASGTLDNDYNCYYRPNGANTGFYVGAQLTMGDWTAAIPAGNDVSSLASSPQFTTATNLHILDDSFCQDKALETTGVGFDIDGDPRDALIPDIGADENLNASTAPGLMTGTYTVGAAQTYLTVKEAADDIANRGQSGAVIFDIYDGTYTESFLLDFVSGHSATNTITFQAAAGQAPIIGPMTLAIDWVTVQDLTITVTNANAIELKGQAADITIQNNTINVSGNTYAGVYVSSSGVDNVRIEGNEFVGSSLADYGIRLAGNATPSTTGWKVYNNIIRGFDNRGINLIGWSGGNLGGEFYYNTVEMDTGRAAHQANSAIQWRNNIFSNLGTSTVTDFCFYHASGTLDNNFNCYYRPNGANTGFFGGNQLNMGNWTNATGQEANGIHSSPKFTSATNLHIGQDSFCQEKATVLAAVSDDIDADTRDLVLPDIGADENTLPSTAPAPMNGTYTVGAAQTYTTLLDAANDLSDRGQDGAVIFDVYTGTYTNVITFDFVSGHSAVNNLTLQQAAGELADIGPLVLAISYIDILDFDEITNLGTEHTIEIKNEATNITISGNTINTSGNTYSGVYINSGGNNNLTLARNSIIGSALADYGIYLNATAAPATTNMKLQNNFVIGFDNRAVFLNAYATGNLTGKATYNTFRMDDPGAVVYASNTALEWRNNLLEHYGTTAISDFCLYFIGGTLDTNYNDYYRPNGANVGFYTATRFSMGDWIAAVGANDANSITSDPKHTLATVVDIADDSFCQEKAWNGSTVLDDINSVTRDLTTPDIGAFENTNASTAPGPMSGLYTVGPAQTYLTLVDAVTDMTDRGINGAVTFDVYTDTYTGPVLIDFVSGVSATNTITFQQAAGQSATVAPFTISSVDYVTLKDFDSIDATNANGITLKNKASDITIIGNTINVTGNLYSAILIEGQENNNLTVDSNEMVGSALADYGIYVNALLANADTTGWLLQNNMIRGFDNAGINIRGGGSSAEFLGNAYHNTIYMDTAGISYCVYNSWGSLTWRNNIFAHVGTAVTQYCFYHFNGTLDTDINDFYRPNGANTGYFTGAQASLIDWLIATAQDSGSISADPKLVSATDLHIGDDSLCQGKAIIGLGVTLDFDGNTRDVSTPDIGADENTNASTAPAPLNGTLEIGGGVIDYTNLLLAGEDLINRGMDGAVSFEVYDGTYTETMGLGAISGSSSTNTITIMKSPSATGPVNIGPILLAGTDYVTIKDFDEIKGTSSHAIRLLSQATNVTVQDTTIAVDGNTYAGILVEAGGSNDLTVQRVEIIGTNFADYGIWLDGATVASTSNWALHNLIIRGVDKAGIYLEGFGAPVSGTAYYNTIHMDPGGAIDTYCAYENTASLEWRNNVFANLGTNGSSYCFYKDFSGALDSNYNNFYRPSGVKAGHYQGTAQEALVDWQIASQQDDFSITGDPNFVTSPTDLHILDDSINQENGVVVTVTDDFDGNTRDLSTPDIGADENTNGSTAPGPLTGIYDIGGSTPDFATLVEASEALINRGISGAVTFDVYTGVYIPTAGTGAVSGNSLVNTITWRKAPTEAAAVNITAIKHYTTDYVTIQDFDFATNITFAASATDGATNNTVDNVVITIADHAVEFIGSGNDNNTIQNCTITTNGLGGRGISGFSGDNNFITIDNNIIDVDDGNGVHLTGTDISITGNTITVDGDGFAGFFGGGDNLLISANEFIGIAASTPDYGMWINGTMTGIAIENNIVRVYDVVGIFLTGGGGGPTGTGTYNTVRMDTGTTDFTYCVWEQDGGLTWRNNLYIHLGTSVDSYCFYKQAGNALDSDYNNFYEPNASKTGLNGVVSNSKLPDWQSSTGQDTNSIQADPKTVTAIDLHIQDDSYCQEAAATGTGVTVDFDGDTRDVVTPDIGADENLTSYTPPAALDGTYDIGGGNNDYINPEVASDDLNLLGQSGPVIFNVYDGTYTGTFALGAITGNSATNTITYQKAPLATGIVSVGPISLSVVDYVTIQDFDSITGIISISGGSSFITITNTTIDVTETAIYLSGTANDDITVSDVTINGSGDHAIHFDGGTNADFTLLRSTVNISDDGLSAIYVEDSITTNMRVERSKLVGSGGADYGIYLFSFGGAPAGWVLQNNFIQDFDEAGVYLQPLVGTLTGEAYHNTIDMLSTAGDTTYCVYEYASDLVWRNNIFSHTGTSSTAYTFYQAADGAGAPDTDFNDHWFPNGVSCGFYTGGQATLADWTTATGGDADSHDFDPEFVSATNLRLLGSSLLIAEGTGLASVTDDYDGQTRDTVTPDIGADEVVANLPPTAPTGLLTEGLTNPIDVEDASPDFQATFNDPDLFEVGNKYRIQVSTDSTFVTVTHWDSGVLGTTMADTSEGSLSPAIPYNGTFLDWGVTYYWRIKFWDDDNGEGDWSTESASFVMILPSITLPNGGPGSEWQMVAVMSNVDINTTDVTGFTGEWYHWAESDQGWDKVTTLKAGEGYIFRSPNDLITLNAGNAVFGDHAITGLTSSDTAFPLLAGWHTLGNPYNGVMNWDDAIEVAPLPTNLESTYWKWDGTQYLSYNATTNTGPAGTSIPKFQAIWTHVLPIGSTGDVTFKEPTVWGESHVPTPFDENWWLLQISAASGDTIRDDYNWMGIHALAEDGWDKRDSSDPGSLADPFIKLYVNHQDWTDGYQGNYAQDVRKTLYVEGDSITWTVEVLVSTTPMEITLTWPNFDEMPGEWKYELDGVDLATIADHVYTQTSSVRTFELTATRVIDGLGTLEVRAGANTPTPAEIAPGATVTMLQLELTAAGEDIDISQLTVLPGGTADFEDILFYHDIDGDGEIDSGEPQISGLIVAGETQEFVLVVFQQITGAPGAASLAALDPVLITGVGLTTGATITGNGPFVEGATMRLIGSTPENNGQGENGSPRTGGGGSGSGCGLSSVRSTAGTGPVGILVLVFVFGIWVAAAGLRRRNRWVRG